MPIRDLAGDAVRSVIRAYHASPRNFDKFDSSKIGTGEGTQSFGHGLYFAGNPKVMEYYYDNFRAASPGQRSSFNDDVIEHAEQTLSRKGSVDDAVAELMDDYRYASQESAWEAQKYMDAADYLRGASPQKPTRYEVALGFPESSLLDYDLPTSQQAEAIQKLSSAIKPRALKSGMPFGGNASVVFEGGGWKLKFADGNSYPLTAADLRRVTGSGGSGADLYQRIVAAEGSPQNASARLLQEGIPGTKYFDEGSRGESVGTRNYVMFPGTEDSITILRKYGLLPATFAAEGLLNQPQQAESTAPAF